MAEELICPECGGLVGGTGKEAHKPCRCFVPPANDSKSDTATLDYMVNARESEDVAVVTAPKPKLCRVCGKNVAGHRRVKDSRGYMCLACAKMEDLQEEERGTPCADCGKRLKDAGLVEYNGRRICKKCHEDHKELNKHKPKVISTKHHEAHEKGQLKLYLLILGALALILFLKWVFGINF
jgi:DNA-directed RNA polymerase subunit RPC12/RpoP